MNICFKHFVSNRLTQFPGIRSHRIYLSTFVVNKNNLKKKFDKRKTEELNAFDSRFGDTFGTLRARDHRFTRLASEDLTEDDDNYDVLHIKRGPKMAEIGYKKQLNKLINKKPIQMREALEVYNKMVSEDRIPPHKCTYSLMINGCAKVGFTQKAFEFFDEMLRYKLRPTQQTITSLFNACAECPFPDYGLERGRYLRQWLALEGFPINTFHYNSMIKAFGKLGDIQTVFELIEEMVANGQTHTEHTFSMLLIGCISNKESGFFDAIQVFRRMKSLKIPVFVHTFNLLLKATKECGIGSENNLNSIIGKPICGSYNPIKESSKNKNCLRIDSGINKTSIKKDVALNQTINLNSLVTKTPNLILNKTINETNIIEIKFEMMSKPCNRFKLFGGIEGFIQMMSDFNVTPDIKTLTLMTELIDLKEESEKQILDLLDKWKIKADTDFFNILIKRLCFEQRLISAKKLLELMSQKGLQPDIVTFGVLALGCNRFSFGKQLLIDMEALNIKPNIQIMGALMSKACQTNEFFYINYLIDYMKDNDIKPDRKIVEKLEAIQTKFQKMFVEYDWNKNKDIPQRFSSHQIRCNFHLFKTKFEDWLKSVTLEEEDHPWNQFQFEELPNKKGMHSFVRFMKQKMHKRRGLSDERLIHEFEEDELYNE